MAAGYAQALEEDAPIRFAPTLDGARSAPRIEVPAVATAKAKPPKSKSRAAAARGP